MSDSIRLHKNLCYAVIDGLHDICNEERYADKVIQQLLKRDARWGSRDRSFIAETTYDIIRWKRLYEMVGKVQKPYSNDALWMLFTVWAVLHDITLPEWPQFATVNSQKLKQRYHKYRQSRVFQESIPDWLDERGVAELGEDLWIKEIQALNQPAEVVLRANTLKTDTKNLRDKLSKEGIETHYSDAHPHALILNKRANVFRTAAFRSGLFEVQDASSQLVAPYLEVEPGMRVVDACAGAGGKSLHLAALMENKGQLIAMDIHNYKLQELKRRARRNGVHNFRVQLIENSKSIKKLNAKCDRVLIDAPCSGLGVLKRNPDTKWKLKPETIADVREKQRHILNTYSRMVKPAGKLVYATCSILPSENREQVDQFLNSEWGKGFTFVKDRVVFAHTSGFDGFYMAQLIRNK